MFAHRGGAGLVPENTLAAFQNGLALGADGIECDVHLSRDGVPVVVHDPTLERTTDATGPVCERTADELARLDAGSRFRRGDAYPYRGQGLGVPTLEAVLRACPDARAIIELKGRDPELARAAVEVVRRTDAVDRVCLGAFDHQTIEVVRRAEPAVATSASQDEALRTLYRSWVRWPPTRPRPYQAFQVPEVAGRMPVVRPGFVRQVHAEGQVLQVWVVDRPDDVRRLLAWGVDGIISDYPDVAIAARDAWRHERGSPAGEGGPL